MVFYDPTGERYGLPTYPFKFAPDGLRPAGNSARATCVPAAKTSPRKSSGVAASVSPTCTASTSRKPEAHRHPRATGGHRQALTARRTCPDCGQVKPYYIPRRTGACLDCTPEVSR